MVIISIKKGFRRLGFSSTQYCIGLLRQIIKLQFFFLLLLTLSRGLFFVFFSPRPNAFALSELADAFVLGLRIDLVLIAYLSALPLLAIIGANLMQKCLPKGVVRGYFITVYLIVSALIAMDFGFYSYFGNHISVMIFGFFDDDTAALVQIGLKNYNIPVILGGIVLYILFVVRMVRRVLGDIPPAKTASGPAKTAAVYAALVLLVVIGARGSFGLFPLLKDIPDVSADPFVNALPQNGVFAFDKAVKQYLKEKEGRYDLIKRVGYGGRIDQAFRDYLAKADINTADPASDLVRTTPENPAAAAHPPHVVVVMVESFGTPILKYQSPDFDIMRRLKKHFDEDIVFTNFISGANGTIVSMEPLLLNLVARPGSIAYGQSSFLGVAFPTAAARVYRKAGYETSFVYGGDLSWRNVGQFFARQGFDRTEGKSHIEAALGDVEEHDWGVYDKHTYDFVLRKLENADRPQFVFIMTTNNHPPYILSKSYDPKELHLSDALLQHLTGDIELAKQRLQDYQYALDMAGRFMDEIKASPLGENTVVAITADNNTIEGIMHYDYPLQESKQVPFYLYLPPYLKREPYDRNVSASHNDLMPTLYGRTLSATPYTALGHDLFERDALHCGYNEAGIIVSSAGAFRLGHAGNAGQQACEKQYKAALAVTEYLLNEAASSKSVPQKGSH